MEPERVISFGCLPNRNLKLSISRSRSKSGSGSGSGSTTSSPRSTTPKSPPSVTPRKSSSSFRVKEDDYREVFRRFDTDNDGKISAAELRAYFGSIREYMSHEEAQSIITDLDTDGDNLIDFQDFLRLMKRESHEGDQQDLKAAFEIFEFQKGSGRITPKSLQKVFSRLGDAKSYDECVAMIDVYDADGKGELHYHEFQEMMTASWMFIACSKPTKYCSEKGILKIIVLPNLK